MEKVPENHPPQDLAFWEKMAGLDPGSVANLPLARAYLYQDQPEKALKVIDPVAAVHPSHHQALLLKSRVLLALGRKAEAADLLGRAGDWIDEIAGWLAELAGQLREIDHDGLAYTAETAAGLLGAKHQPHPHLAGRPKTLIRPMIVEAALLVSKGNIDGAVQAYQEILNLDPSNNDVRSALAELTGQWPDNKEMATNDVLSPVQDNVREAKKRVIHKLERLRDAARRRREKVQAAL